MDFDPEILVRLAWAGMPMRFLPVAVHYPEGGVSHFRLGRDNALISWMHTRLFFGMLLRLPVLAWRRASRAGSPSGRAETRTAPNPPPVYRAKLPASQAQDGGSASQDRRGASRDERLP